MYPFKLLKNKPSVENTQQKSNLGSECCHHVITVTDSSQLAAGALGSYFILWCKGEKPQHERELSPEFIGFITSTFSTPKWHKRNYHTLQTTFGAKEVMGRGGNRSKRVPSDEFVHAIREWASLRVGNQDSILRKS